jgi:Domain of unknown function (DUF4845)
MNTIYRQRGMSAIGLLFVLMIIGFLATCAIKLLPHYIDSWTLNSFISKSIEDSEYQGMSIREIRSKISKYMDVNRLESIKAKELKISKKKGVTLIDAGYEKRVPFMFNIDVVIKFDELIYEFSVE